MKSITLRLFLMGLLVVCGGGFAPVESVSAKSRASVPREQVPVLEPGDQVNSNFVNRYSVNSVAESIVKMNVVQERKLKDKLKNQVSVDLLKNSDIIIFMLSEDSKKIGGLGVLNFHQIERTNGTPDYDARYVAEDRLSGVKMSKEEETKSLRPKSAYLNIRSSVKLSAQRRTAGGEGDYGGVGIVLKPELMRRSLWVADDSLTVGNQAKFFSSPEKAMTIRGTFDRNAIYSSIDRANDYYEAIVFGEIRLEHISHFLVEEEKFAAGLFKYKIPVYLWKVDTVHGRHVYTKARRLDRAP